MKLMDPALKRAAIALYRYLDTPTALACYICLQHGEFGELAALAVPPSRYLDTVSGASRFARDAQAVDFLRKSPLLPARTERQKKEESERLFLSSEEQCRETNILLRRLKDIPDMVSDHYLDSLRHILCRAEKIVGRILGPVPADISCGFGPGTSFEFKDRAFVTLADKLWGQPHVTSRARPIFEWSFYSTLWGRSHVIENRPLPADCLGNRFTTVNKDAFKHRGICVEPGGNLWCQLGIGRHMKRRLAAVGIHVDKSPVLSVMEDVVRRVTRRSAPNGQKIHQALAREGSMTGKWATIDLSNASDTVAKMLVWWVMPPDWYELLVSLRSPFTLFRKEWVELEKFSSMGNGFTFELETLIFLALISSVTGLRVGEELFCYGDDIIVPQEHAREALAVLKACGFTPNPKKTFTQGPFRESCGGDYFGGFDVRAVFQTSQLDSPTTWIDLHNHLREKWPFAKAARRVCADQVPRRYRLWGPPSISTVLHTTDESRWRSWHEDGCRWLATIKVIPVRIPLDRWDNWIHIPAALMGAKSSGLSPRRMVEGWSVTKASIS